MRTLNGPDPHRLATLRNFRSLMPMAQEACEEDFRMLALEIANRCDLQSPPGN